MNFKYEINYQNKQDLTLTVVYIPENTKALSTVRVINYNYTDTEEQIKDIILSNAPFDDWERAISQEVPDIELGTFESNTLEAKESFNKLYKVELTLDDLKNLKKEEIEAQLVNSKNLGVSFEFTPTETDLVQIRDERDQINIINLVNMALNTKSNDPIFVFRAESNKVYDITAEQVLEMNNAVNEFIEALYQKSWELKQLINDAKTEEELELITWF